MGITLPNYQPQVKKQAQSIEMPANRTLGKSEIASPIPEAVENAGDKLNKQAEGYADYVQREETRQKQDLILNTRNKITAGIDDLLYNNEPDDKGQAKGLLFRTGTNVEKSDSRRFKTHGRTYTKQSAGNSDAESQTKLNNFCKR